MNNYNLLCGDVIPTLRTLPSSSVQCVVTSPPYYGLRNYGVDGQIGLEETPETYVEKLVSVFREVHKVLCDDGTVWINLGDSYVGYKGANYGVRPETSNLQKNSKILTAHNLGTPHMNNGMKNKDLIGVPWMVAFALRTDGWYLRQDIIWHKPNPMPESVKDRCTKAHEYVFLLSKSPKYYFDSKSIKEPVSDATIKRSKYRWQRTQNGGGSPESMNGYDYSNQDFGEMSVDLAGRNKRSVWSIPTKSYKGAHFATFPEKLVEPCILAGSKENDTVLDPFCGSGTTGVVALRYGRKFIGIDLNPEYIKLAEQRIQTFLSGGTTWTN